MIDAVTSKTREELTDVGGVQRLLWKIARTFAPPDGYTHEDLVSEANVALCKAKGRYDPEFGEFTTFAGAVAKHAILALIDHAKRQKRGGGRAPAPLEQEDADGERFGMPADRKAADPAEIAIARESLQPRRRTVTVRRAEESLPSPAEVADQVVRLRAAMFAAISEKDVADVMQSMVRAAKDGDAKAAKLLVDLLAPARSGTVVNQPIIINPSDVT